MSLQSRITALAQAIAADVKTVEDAIRSHIVPVGWWVMPQNTLSTGALAQTAGQAGFNWIDLPAGTYDQLAINVAVAQVAGTTTTYLGLYKTDPATGLPDTTPTGLVMSGTVTTTATGTRTTASAPVALPAGRYWTCHLYVQTAAPTTQATVQSNNNSVGQPPNSAWRTPGNWRGWTRTAQTALPNTATTTANVGIPGTANVAFIAVRRSA